MVIFDIEYSQGTRHAWRRLKIRRTAFGIQDDVECIFRIDFLPSIIETVYVTGILMLSRAAKRQELPRDSILIQWRPKAGSEYETPVAPCENLCFALERRPILKLLQGSARQRGWLHFPSTLSALQLREG